VTIKKRALPIVPPDLDKLLRGLLDGIGQSEVIWGDDSQVVQIDAVKLYADETEPGATVTIYGL
jgi:Holliday junction resolvase RusA-like endonuclease